VSVLLLGRRNEHAARLQDAGVPVASLGKRGWWDIAVLLRLLRHLRRERPEILHSTLFHANLLAAALARRRGVRVLVLSQRGSYEHNLPLPVPAFWRRLARWSARRADVLIVNSEATAAEEKAAGVQGRKIVVIPNGVRVEPVARVSRAELGLPEGPLAVAVGRLEGVKGHAHLLDAWPAVIARHPGASLAVLGEGSRSGSLNDGIERASLRTRVLLLGERPALPYIAAADVLVHPSLSEGMPNVVLEAMALGTPVVATRVGGTPEVVTDGQTGLLVPPGDPAALADALSRLLADAALRTRLAAAATEHVRTRHALAGMVRATEAAYERALSDGRGSRRLLVFGHRPYPNDHAVLDTVFTRELPRAGWTPVWVLQPAEPGTSGRRAEWNGTPVYVTRRHHWRGVRRHLELLREYVATGEEALRDHEVAAIQARTGLPEGLAAWWLARRHRRPFVFQYSFPIPLARRQALEHAGRPLLGAALFAIERRLVDALLRRADLVLAVSETMAAALRGVGVTRAVPFPLGADTTVAPESVRPFAAPAETVVYVGSTDPKRNPQLILEVMRRVRDRCPSAHLLVVGEAAPEYRQAAARLGLADAVTFAGRVPRSEVPRYLRAARCSLAPIPPSPLYVVSSATKVVESLGMAVPVVTNGEIPDQRELVERSGGGLVTSYDPDALAEAVVALLRDPAEATRRGEAGRRYVSAHRSYEVLARELASRYETLVAEHDAPRRTSR
jgi:glycosyltransferase involved in cell wall biosynthesis